MEELTGEEMIIKERKFYQEKIIEMVKEIESLWVLEEIFRCVKHMMKK